MSQYVDVEVLTQSASDTQWGVFDFENIHFDIKTGNIKKNEDEYEKKAKHCEICSFEVKGTSYLSRTSKYEMM